VFGILYEMDGRLFFRFVLQIGASDARFGLLWILNEALSAEIIFMSSDIV
jgi:hypothetical protein